MPESDTILLQRLIALRHIPAFATVELDELATLADNAVEVRFEPGQELVAAGATVPDLHVVLEGRIEMAGRSSRAWDRYEVFGTLEVLANRPIAKPAIARVATRTLRLSGVAFADLLEDNFGILVGVLRVLARAVTKPERLRPRTAIVATAQPLGLVDRLILFRQHPLFARGELQALSMLAHLSAERTWPTNAEVVTASDVASDVMFIVSGMLHGPRDERYGAGDALGLIETLGSLGHPSAITAATPVRALISRGASVFDVLEDHSSLGLAMLTALASSLLAEDS
jgi:CRP-like cAMP-binding protein